MPNPHAGMPSQTRFIDDSHIKNTSGPMKDYPNKLFQIVQHDNVKVSGAQLLTIFKKLNSKDQQVDACKLGPFVTNLSGEELLNVVKSIGNHDTKITAIMSFHSSLNPGTTYAEKEKIAKTLNQSSQKQVMEAMCQTGGQAPPPPPAFPGNPGMPAFPGNPGFNPGMPGFPTPPGQGGMPGFMPMPATQPAIDEAVINNKQGMNNDYANRILAACQSGRIIKGEQMARIMKNTSFKDPKMHAAQHLAPFVRGLTADHLVTIIKAGCFEEDKISVLRSLAPMLDFGTTPQDKNKVVQAFSFSGEKDKAKQILGL